MIKAKTDYLKSMEGLSRTVFSGDRQLSDQLVLFCETSC